MSESFGLAHFLHVLFSFVIESGDPRVKDMFQIIPPKGILGPVDRPTQVQVRNLGGLLWKLRSHFIMKLTLIRCYSCIGLSLGYGGARMMGNVIAPNLACRLKNARHNWNEIY